MIGHGLKRRVPMAVLASLAMLGLFVGCQPAAIATQPDGLVEFGDDPTIETPDTPDGTGGENLGPSSMKRVWPARRATYVGRGARHWPLYFEDIPVERSGCSVVDVAQAPISVDLMGLQLAVVPYNLFATPPWVLQEPSRPAEPPVKCGWDLSLDPAAALFEAAVIVGLMTWIP